MSRRGHGEGSIFQRHDGKWAAVIDLGYRDGRRARKWFYGETRREVHEKLTAGLRARQSALPIPTDRLTTEEYLLSWLKSRESALRPRTRQRYEQYLRLHAIPCLGRVPLAKLSAQHLQELYADRLRRGLSAGSVHHLHAVLHTALRQAERHGLVVRNVAGLAEPPRVPRREMSTLDPSEARRFLEAAAADRLHAIYVVALTTGMRQGELLGLRWREVDLEGAGLRVTTTVQQTRETRDGFVFAEPKTLRSRRHVALTPMAVAALKRHRLRQTEERLRLGEAWADFDLVFPNAVGRPLDPSNLTKSFHELLRSASCPRIRFHDLRHTAATLLLGRGVHPKVVSEMLGHSQIAVTLDLYSHVTPTMQREAVAALEAVLTA